MALSATVQQITQKTTTGNQSYTGFGFKPKIIILWGNKLSSNTNGTDASFGFGVATTATDNDTYAVVNGNGDLSNAAYTNNAHCYSLIQSGAFANILALAELVSMDADGFTLHWTTTDGTARLINVLALGGGSFIRAGIGVDTAKTTNGTKATTGVGFKPDCLFIFASGALTTNGGTNTRDGVGWSDGTTDFSVSTCGTRNTNPSILFHAQRPKIVALNNGSTIFNEANIQSFDPDGFTLNWTTTNGGANVFSYIALKGVLAKTGVFNQPTSTGNQAQTGIGFTPSALILQSACRVTSATLGADEERSLGAGVSSSVRACTWMGSTNGQTSSGIANSDLDNTKIIKLLTEGTPTVNASADLVSLDSDGFTLNWGTVDATAREVGYLALAAAPDRSFLVGAR